jgi:glycosyltransferase involved in cell wall biosynthesis
LNVLHLIGSFAQGGSERQALQLARIQREAGRNQIHLACFNGEGSLRSEADALGFHSIPEFPLHSFHDLHTVRQLGRFARLLVQLRIDVIQTHDFYTNVFGMAAGALSRTRVRIAARRETLGCRTSAQRKLEHGAYRLSHAIVANAEAVRNQLIVEGVRPEKITTVYNGLDLKRVIPRQGFDPDECLRSFGLPSDHQFVTLVANMRHPVKDHPTFLRAARRILKEAPQTGFILAGEGELVGEIQNLAGELDIRDQTFFVGRCDRLAELLAISNVCVLSSLAEGFSNSILEYMAAGRPVVATEVGGAREAIVEGETGYLVPPGNYEQLADRVTSLLLSSAKATDMGARGRQLVEEKFSCENQLRRTQDLYERVFARNMSSVSSNTPHKTELHSGKISE